MENLILTSFTSEELRKMFRDEIEQYFSKNDPGVSDKMLNIEQASDFLKLKVATIYTLHCRKQIPAHKRGKRLYFSVKDLNQWLRVNN